MGIPEPSLPSSAQVSIDTFLHDAMKSGNFPAITLGAIGVTGEPLYFACEGDRVHGEPDKGKVDQDTCAYSP